MRFRAAVLYELNKPLRIEELEVPPLLSGQVLVKLAYSGVCRSQLMEVRGRRGYDPYLPHLLGHEGSGTVVETGPLISKVKPGDRVVLGWIKGKGMDVPGAKYRKDDGTIINSGGVTTFSEYSVVSENRCVKLPDGIPMDCAVLFGCAIPTGAGIVMNRVRPVEGSTIAIFGLGGIGMSALMATRLFDCSMVATIDVASDKLKLARDFGATHAINAATQDVLKEVDRITLGKGVDYSVETSGIAHSIELAFRAVRKFGGLCVFASHPPSGPLRPDLR
jgi:S-(hydroxymethyl)glutathione dehydrogenase/alcohol dehydrogenase